MENLKSDFISLPAIREAAGFVIRRSRVHHLDLFCGSPVFQSSATLVSVPPSSWGIIIIIIIIIIIMIFKV